MLRKSIAIGLLVSATIAFLGWKRYGETNQLRSNDTPPAQEAATPADGSFQILRAIDGDTIVVTGAKGQIRMALT